MNPYTNYGAGLAQTASAPPSVRLPVNRGLLSWLLLSMVTFGIYPIIALANISSEVNLVASNRDRLHTTNGVLVFFLAFPTLGIYPFVWWHKISDRIGGELRARGVDYSFDAGSFWLWGVFGSLFCGLGSLVFIHKFTTAMNRLNEHYNAHGTSYPVAAVPAPVPVVPVPAPVPTAPAPVGFVAAPAPLPPVEPADPANAPIVPVSVAGSGRALRAAPILLAVGTILGIVVFVWVMVEWRGLSDPWEVAWRRGWCFLHGIEHISRILFLVGVFLLAASRFRRSGWAACFWILSAVSLFVSRLFTLPFFSRILARWEIFAGERWVYLIGQILFAVGVFVAGILLLTRRRTGVMVCLFVAAAGTLVPVLFDAYSFLVPLFQFLRGLRPFELWFLRWGRFLLSGILMVAGLVVLALAVRKASLPGRNEAARP